MRTRKVEENRGVFLPQVGGSAQLFYLVTSGRCGSFTDGTMTCALGPGSCFGETALMYGGDAADATIRAMVPSTAWSVSRCGNVVFVARHFMLKTEFAKTGSGQTSETLKKERRFCRGDFERVVLGAAMARRTAYDSFLATMPLLQPLDQAERGAIADSLVPRTLAEGEVCVDEGEVTTAIFFVQSGELEARQPSICTTAGASQGQATASAAAEVGSFGGLELTLDEPSAAAAAGGEAGAASYRTGDYFGAVSLLTDAPQPRAIAATASAGGAVVLSLERRAFKRLVGAKTKSSAELRQVRVPSGNENTLSFFLSNSFTLSFLRK